MTADLFESVADVRPSREAMAEGAVLLRGFARSFEAELLPALRAILKQAPFRHLVTPGGHRMSVAMTNCGTLGWVSDHTGYRYDAIDPEFGQPWPAMPPALRRLAADAADDAGFNNFEPDKDELDFGAPIVSVSLGLAATFLFGGPKRADKPNRYRLEHGDVVVWGGPSRLFFHGVAPLADGEHAVMGRQRINLTFRKVR